MSINSAKILALCFIMALVSTGIKAIVWMWTDSSAVAADLIDSSIHLAMTAFVIGSARYANKPPDEDHRYGHGKIAYCSMALEGILLMGGAVLILQETWESWSETAILKNPLQGAVLEGLIALAYGAVALSLLRLGKREQQHGIEAHGRHLFTDSIGTIVVTCGLFFVWLTGWQWIDSVVAIAIACYLACTAMSLLWRAQGGLLEKADKHMHKAILNILNRAVEGRVLEDFHQLRHRQVNKKIWIDLHMLFTADISLQEAHSKASQIELDIIEAFPNNEVHVTSHLEPLCHQEAHPMRHPDFNPLY